ncbi:MAG: peptidase, partial [Deltaproteobacteria bacterium]
MSRFNEAFKSLFAINMGVRKGERIVVFSDTIRPDENPFPADADRRTRLRETAEAAAGFAGENYGNASFVSYPSTVAPGAEPPELLWREALGDAVVDLLAGDGILAPLLSKTASRAQLVRAEEIVLAGKDSVADLVLAMANHSTSHTRFRLLVNAAGGRFASLPNFDPEMFFSSMQVDWSLLAERTARLAEEVNRAVEIVVQCPNGTMMRFLKSGRVAAGDDGLLTAPASFGNLPAGEVYLAPLEGTSEG